MTNSNDYLTERVDKLFEKAEAQATSTVRFEGKLDALITAMAALTSDVGGLRGKHELADRAIEQLRSESEDAKTFRARVEPLLPHVEQQVARSTKNEERREHVLRAVLGYVAMAAAALGLAGLGVAHMTELISHATGH